MVKQGTGCEPYWEYLRKAAKTFFYNCRQFVFVDDLKVIIVNGLEFSRKHMLLEHFRSIQGPLPCRVGFAGC